MTFWDEPVKITGEEKVLPSERTTEEYGSYFMKRAPKQMKKAMCQRGELEST
jgi:hypothetical protein